MHGHTADSGKVKSAASLAGAPAELSPELNPAQALPLIAGAIQDVVWLAEPVTHRIHYVNHAFERIWGYSAEQLYADCNLWKSAIDPADRAEVERRFGDIDRLGKYEADYRIHRPDGQMRWIRDRGWLAPATDTGPAWRGM